MRLRVLTKLKVVILMIGMILGSRMGLGIVSVVGSASSINPQAGGMASKYPGDSGIAEDPDVVFADDFESWSDGQLSIRREGLRFRRVPQLRITYFSLETYYHGLPGEFSQDNPIRVYFDNVVIARKYIGTMK